jgi:hypothetical protein
MNHPSAATTGHIAVVLDDVAAAAALLEWSSALAQSLRREVRVVYVESASALAAATLPLTQALAHAGASWVPYGPQDVELGYRVQLVRLREMLRQAAERHAIHGSLQVVRGALHAAALELNEQSDLVLVGAAAPVLGAARSVQRCHSMLVWADDSEQGLQLVRVATLCAQALGATQRRLHVDVEVDAAEVVQARADLLVMPRQQMSARSLARARQPVLLVGNHH